jgi:lysozyme
MIWLKDFLSWLESLFVKNEKPKLVDVPVEVKPPVKPPQGISERILGVDVSKYQKPLDWNLAYKQGVRFAFIKASDGKSGADPAFKQHREAAKAAGILVGCYHYFRFDANPGEQADNFVKITGGVLPGELPHVIDVEWDRYSKKYGEGKRMDDAAVNLAHECLLLVALKTHKVPILYTNKYFWPDKVHLPERFDAYKIWVPSYAVKSVDQVKIPHPWKKLTFWQFSDKQNLGGVSPIDGDYFFGSIEELKAMVKA